MTEPASSRVLVGTSGFSYADWVGPFYPAGCRPAQYLELYCRRFHFVEVNTSFYRMPTPDLLAGLDARVPDDFRFTVKAYRSFSHDLPNQAGDWRRPSSAIIDRLRTDAEQFSKALCGLRRDHLVGVLVQFPFRFHYTPSNRYYLALLADTLAEQLGASLGPANPADPANVVGPANPDAQPSALATTVFVEFRNADWELPAVQHECERRNLAKVVVDQPALPGLPPAAIDQLTTAGTLYLRCHGRNAGEWWNGTNNSRYCYEYSDAELTDLLGMVSGRPLTVVAFNNHFEARAARNAARFSELLAAPTDQIR